MEKRGKGFYKLETLNKHKYVYIAAALEAFGNILSASFVENNVLPKFARRHSYLPLRY